MQIFPKVRHLNICWAPEFVPDIDENGWSIWGEHARNWVLEWELDEGITCQVNSEKDKPFGWSSQTWHVYAPGEKYRVNYRHRKRKHENLWILFGIDKPAIPGITGSFTVIQDPESRIANIVRHMYQVQQTGLLGHKELLRYQMQMIMAEVRCSSFSRGEGTAEKPFTFNPTGECARTQEPTLLEKVDSIITHDIYAPPSMEELASTLNMSVSSLSHRFKSETTWNIIQRVRWLRIQHAKKLLLKNGGYSSIKNTARKLGFSSPFYFSKVFKEITGISPREFLRLS